MSEKTCTVEDCSTPTHARELCKKHYHRMLRHGDPGTVLKVMRGGTCSVEGCEEAHTAHGYCARHVAKWYRHGDPTWEQPEPQRYCAMGNCFKVPHGYGLCHQHYDRWRRWGDPFFDGRHYPECEVEGCYKKRTAKRYCHGHFERWRRYGSPLGGVVDSPLGVNLALAPLEGALVDAGGLSALMYANGIREEDPEHGRWQKAIKRARERGSVDAAVADRFAVKLLGTHPALVWGEEWWEPDTAPVARDLAA